MDKKQVLKMLYLKRTSHCLLLLLLLLVGILLIVVLAVFRFNAIDIITIIIYRWQSSAHDGLG